MKLKCIKSYIGITEGNIYEVLKDTSINFSIIEDDGEIVEWSWEWVVGYGNGGKLFEIFNEVESITLPIEDYNRLRKLEIKQKIKQLKKELKGL